MRCAGRRRSTEQIVASSLTSFGPHPDRSSPDRSPIPARTLHVDRPGRLSMPIPRCTALRSVARPAAAPRVTGCDRGVEPPPRTTRCSSVVDGGRPSPARGRGAPECSVIHADRRASASRDHRWRPMATDGDRWRPMANRRTAEPPKTASSTVPDRAGPDARRPRRRGSKPGDRSLGIRVHGRAMGRR